MLRLDIVLPTLATYYFFARLNTLPTWIKLISLISGLISSCALPRMNSHVPSVVNDSFKKKKLPIKNQTAMSKSFTAPKASYRRCMTICSCPTSTSNALWSLKIYPLLACIWVIDISIGQHLCQQATVENLSIKTSVLGPTTYRLRALFHL